MESQAPTDFSAPVHKLGQYAAWMRADAAFAPIDLVWLSAAPACNPKRHRMLPHGEPSIAIRRRRDRHGHVTSLDLTICGAYSRGAYYAPSPSEELIGVRLKPEASATFFGVFPADFVNQSPRDAPGRVKEACHRSLLAAQSAPASEVLKLLCEDLLRFSFKPWDCATPERQAAALLRGANGRLRCREIAAVLDVSERHLRRRFSDHLGITPKTYANQLRLTAAALTAEKVANPDWAQIALHAGFHDQSHMINAFSDALGVSPTAFHRERRALADSN